MDTEDCELAIVVEDMLALFPNPSEGFESESRESLGIDREEFEMQMKEFCKEYNFIWKPHTAPSTSAAAGPDPAGVFMAHSPLRGLFVDSVNSSRKEEPVSLADKRKSWLLQRTAVVRKEVEKEQEVRERRMSLINSNVLKPVPPPGETSEKELFPGYRKVGSTNNRGYSHSISGGMASASGDRRMEDYPPFDKNLFQRYMRGEVRSMVDQATVKSMLFSQPLDEIEQELLSLYKAFGQLQMNNAISASQQGKKKRFTLGRKKILYPYCDLDKSCLRFGLPPDHEAPLGLPLTETVTMYNRGMITLDYEVTFPPAVKSHQISVVPVKGTLRKDESVKIVFTLSLRATIHLLERVVIQVHDYARFALPINLRSEKALFGVVPSELVRTADQGRVVPEVLVHMKRYFVERNGHKDVVGIFRLQGDEMETLLVKDQLNKGVFVSCKDINCVSTLIKVWFRELPIPLLNTVEPSKFKSVRAGESMLIFSSIPALEQELFAWLLDLLVLTNAYEAHNKMTTRNLAIVLAPNLFDTAEMDPMEALILSQKVVSFLEDLLDEWKRLHPPSLPQESNSVE